MTSTTSSRMEYYSMGKCTFWGVCIYRNTYKFHGEE